MLETNPQVKKAPGTAVAAIGGRFQWQCITTISQAIKP